MKNIILIFVFSICGFGIVEATQYKKPKIFNSGDGLSNTKINDITQDEKGYLWVATDDGLNKFDGYHFSVYKKADTDSTSLLNNYITALCFASNNCLWVGSMSGLQYYDATKDCFVRASLGQSESVISGSYNCITEDSQKNLWLSIHHKGVVKYSIDTHESILYRSKQEGGPLSSSSIRHIVEDIDGNIWFASFDNGITVYNPSKHEFSYYNMTNTNLPTNSILRISQLASGEMIISSLGNGVFIFNRITGEVKKVKSEISSFAITQLADKTTLVGSEGEGLYVVSNGNTLLPHATISKQENDILNSKIHCIFEDGNKNIWIGMYNGGLCYLSHEPEGFVKYSKAYDNANSLSYEQVSDIAVTKNGEAWFATDGGGLNCYNPKTKKYTHYKHNPNNRNSLPDDAVVKVYIDQSDDIWVGTYIGGLAKLDKKSKSFVSYQHSDNKNSLPGNFVKCITQDDEGIFWIGSDGSGLSRFNAKTNSFRNFSALDNRGLVSDNIISLYLQNNQTLWIGTYVGISRLDIQTNEFISYKDDSIARNLSVYSIVKDSSNNLWFGTSSGLFKHNTSEDRFEKYEIPFRIQDVVINGIVPYKEQLWLSTNNGIICYIPKKKKIKAMISNSDLGGISFIKSSYYLSPDNEIFFGGGNGCYSFHPDSLNIDQYSPKTYITELQIFNNPIQVGKDYNGRKILPKAIDKMDEIQLKYSENTFTLSFCAPMAEYQTSYSYSYKLDGVDQQWIAFSPTQQSVTYANLSPGSYTFKVYASNTPLIPEDGISSLQIKVSPPWWLTWWAKCGYVLSFIIILSIILWVIYNRVKDKNELYVEKMKLKKQEELNQNKIQFFTNISHEFRTPLTLIISPLNELVNQETDKERARVMNLMLRNANRLLRLINQILDFRKADNNQLKIKAQRIELISFSQYFLDVFSEVARKRHINLNLKYNTDDIEVWYDADLLEKCIYNLVFNALKYTLENGNITIELYKEANTMIYLKVRDDGAGINPKDLPYLFDRFYQGEFSNNSGTGVGLHMVKTIVELHGGSIEAENNNDGQGSCFTLKIIDGKEHLNPDSCDERQWTPSETNFVVEEVLDEKDNIENIIAPEIHNKKTLILLVEDEADMRMYVKLELEKSYTVIEASNGVEAFEKLKSITPDLIVADIMMPKMDGIEFTQNIKDNLETCHIPVILLTANSEIDYKLRGLEIGADSYIVKPFNADYLRMRIKKLLEMRKTLQEKYSKLLNLEAKEMETTNPDELLLQKSITFIRDNIDSPTLSVEEIAINVGISRAHLHRKTKTLTGQTPIDLIKTIRMKQAKSLLETKDLNISEVAFMVGYNSLSYFSSSFTSYWGVSPSSILKNK